MQNNKSMADRLLAYARELAKINEAENNYSDDTVTETQNRQKK